MPATSVNSQNGVISPVGPATYPIIEIFGPTIQGEGRYIGHPCFFIRLGGCDYRCSWCDSLHAVLPSEVKKNARLMTVSQIVDELQLLDGYAQWIIISGGNPALHRLSPLITELKSMGFKIAMETQGSKFPRYLGDIDHLTLSPKPPSSEMETNFTVLESIFTTLMSIRETVTIDVKIVVFDEADLEYARDTFVRLDLIAREMRPQKGVMEAKYRKYISIGTYVDESTRDELLDRQREMVEQTRKFWDFGDVSILPQMHVLLWGHAKGV